MRMIFKTGSPPAYRRQEEGSKKESCHPGLDPGSIFKTFMDPDFHQDDRNHRMQDRDDSACPFSTRRRGSSLMNFIRNVASLLIFLTACTPLYQDKGAAHCVHVKQLKSHRDYLAYRLEEEIKRRLHFLPTKESLVLNITVQEGFHSLVHLPDINVGRSLGEFFVKLEVRKINRSPFYETEFRHHSAYTPDPYQEFANLRARQAIEDQVVCRLAEEIIMRVSSQCIHS